MSIYFNFLFTFPKDFNLLVKASSVSILLNSIISSLFKLHFLIFSLISFILFILFSILMELVINCPNLLLSFHSLFIDLHFSKDIFIFSGSFSPSLNISSLQKILLYWLSTSDNNSSSRSFKTVLIFVNVF